MSKASIGTITTANNPIQTSINSVNRTWNDLNGNYVPDCDLSNRAANGECGPMANQNFGGLNVTTHYADDAINGFGARGYNWDFTTEVQHQLRPGVSITGGYYRNWFGNFLVTDNTLVAPSDFSPFCVTAPQRQPFARGRRLSDLRLVRRVAGEVRPGQQRGYTVGQLREDDARQRLLQRDAQRAARPEPSGRRRCGHRPQRERRVLQRRFSRRVDRRASRKPRWLDGWRALHADAVHQHDHQWPVGLQDRHALRRPDAVQRLHRLSAAARFHRERGVPEHFRADHRRQLFGVQQRDRPVARPQSRGLRDETRVHVHGDDSADCARRRCSTIA